MALPFARILFTGGTGFVGGYLAPAIAAATPNAERLLLRRPGESREHAGWDAVDVEIDDAGALRDVVGRLRPDLVLHLAAQASVNSLKALEETWRVNRDGAFAVASACVQAGGLATFVFVSSSEVYGDSFRDGAATETTPLLPTSAYGQSKAAAEGGLRERLPGDVRLIVFRPFNHTGVGQDRRFVLPSFAAQVADMEAGRHPPWMEVGNLDVSRDFLDVRDVCDAYLSVIHAQGSLPRLGEPGGDGNVFNICSGAPRRIGDLLDLLHAQARIAFDVRVDPARLRSGDIPMVTGSSARLEALTGWRPQIAIEETLGEMLEHFRTCGDSLAGDASATPGR